MSFTGDANLDHYLSVIALAGGLAHVNASQHRNAKLLTVIVGSSLLVCVVSCAYSNIGGHGVDTRQLIISLILASFVVYHAAPFAYVATKLFSSFFEVVRSKSDNNQVDRSGMIRVVRSTFRTIYQNKQPRLREYLASHGKVVTGNRVTTNPVRYIYILTTEIGSARHTDSGKGLAASWLFKDSPKFQHWTIMVDNFCYELGRLRDTKGGKYEYGIRVEAFAAWKARRSISSVGLATMMGKYNAGRTTRTLDDIKQTAKQIWLDDFKGTYAMDRQNCQNFADKLQKRIRLQDFQQQHGHIVLSRKLSSTYWKATRPVRVPWYIAKYSTLAAGYPAYLGVQALAEWVNSWYVAQEGAMKNSGGGDVRSRVVPVAADVGEGGEEATAALLEEEEIEIEEGSNIYFKYTS